jgi:hypothetical protein
MEQGFIAVCWDQITKLDGAGMSKNTERIGETPETSKWLAGGGAKN